MRRDIAFRLAVGMLYGVAAYATFVISRGVEPFWAVLAVVIGMASGAGLIHWSALRVHERRYVPRSPEQ
ncbi:hypothetical protein ACFFOS_11840 [Nocardioides kongjuensis]|uniref:ABC-type branched-subunit amino acid transport system permease subunit n=1 Tax=Nocardioides kongjuensis TaxID=349522 RepID=A0A852R852_9ACTN|nr:hypothetical protein [Nocardioides kongjuensis]NYD29127.1 ABC-type branched-subunit amino acid transport system permease subunit [Nocardioides kongjuensis]